MKSKLLLLALLAIALAGCKNQQSKPAQAEVAEFAIVTPSDLVDKISSYQDTKIETEGLITHVCRTGGKMKMVTDNGTIITIYPGDTTEKYDADLARKIVKVQGVAHNKVAEAEHACEHDHAKAEEGCEHESTTPAAIITITCNKYEVVRDVDAES